MNYLRRSWASCVLAVRGYHQGVRRLRLSARVAADPSRTRAQLEQLLFDLEVDVTARRQSLGTDRMTRVEEDVLYPALRQLEARLAALDAGAAPGAWLPTLDAALSSLRRSVRAIRDWKRLNLPPGRRPATRDHRATGRV